VRQITDKGRVYEAVRVIAWNVLENEYKSQAIVSISLHHDLPLGKLLIEDSKMDCSILMDSGDLSPAPFEMALQ
jgi:hypothetical protein